ncbi:hypothetical protein HMPREF9370_2008 [Neisseria wadsworthii 9715]|uniref:Uncharacterized protein n=1 Tax=Neisseria wadsworthii 9715 TaxID=1030841 RepID=G4CSE8_9NEIS|nr:hypothetical protein HMPREF9370_2008 [Neisseria wadsworthii 9715]
MVNLIIALSLVYCKRVEFPETHGAAASIFNACLKIFFRQASESAS